MIFRPERPQTSSILDDLARRHRAENQNSEVQGGQKKPTTREKGEYP
jgi:hypothetical protein